MPKVCSLREAVSSISPGEHIALPGFAITRCAMAFAHEIIRQNIDHLTISQCVGAMDADLLVGAGMVERFIYGGGSLDRFGRLNQVNQTIENGTLKVEEYSSLSVTFRYLAGALGIPFIPIHSLRGSDLLKQIEQRNPGDTAYINDPFSGEKWLTLKPLLPDVAIALVQAADEEGNARIAGPRWDNLEQIRASKRTIVITNSLISTEEIRKEPEKTIVPGFFVTHVVELPFAAHPTSMYGAYDYDANHIKDYVAASQSELTYQAYLDTYIRNVKDHQEYMSKIGDDAHWKELIADPGLGY